ncbi:hypothetical protein yc1106_06701 [Curvularia clavata]|uniref:Heterokaryon incompatibility domain-containing protein n=1 Tax=Curvularia clavata TaxID=95742 RepID=A0A9Q8ZC87_CURCL|nr:hypothetical protein yc1106_06701 [Curvularia clavata]
MEGSRPKIVYGEEAKSYVTEVLDNCVWRRATVVDGKTYWATDETGGIGEQIQDGKFKVRHMGGYLLLAPIDEDDSDDPEARAKAIQKLHIANPSRENDARVTAFVKSVAERLIKFHRGRKEPEDQQEGAFRMFTEKTASDIIDKITQAFVEILSEYGREVTAQDVQNMLDEDAIATVLFVKLTDFLPDLLVDRVLVTDVHGYLDDDFDNPGPELRPDSQMISSGLLSFQNKDFEGLRQRVLRTNVESLLRPLNRMDVKENDDGYESDSSRVSQEHCRMSPYYPPCDDDCWLRHIPLQGERAAETNAATIVTKSVPPIYQSLEPDYIRILTIQPGLRDTTLSCELTACSISSLAGDASGVTSIPFKALSYTWGDPTPCHIIKCNGYDLPIANNLYYALQYLRETDRPVAFWIDAICINQYDVAEKSEQIRHMYEVYQFATQVVVWLGPHYDNSELAMQSINHLENADNRHSILRRDHGAVCISNLERVVIFLESLFQRQWFSRSWIRQEIAAARKVIVKCGNDEIPWSSLKKIANCMWRLQEKIVSSGSEDTPHVIDKFRSSPLRYLRRKLFPGQSLVSDNGDLRSLWYYHAGGFLDYLMVSRVFEATDPRDKVYAVLGIADVPIESNDSLEAHGDHTPKMRVDYGAGVSEVYQYTAKYIINRDRNLDILCILSTHRDKNSSDLPTWTPDWRVPVSSIPMYANWDYVGYKFGAAGFTNALWQNQDEVGILVAQGFLLSTITELVPLGITSIPHPPEEPAGTAESFDPQEHLRRMALTSKGNSIVPSQAEVGDEVWILWGCKLPIVLRTVGDAGCKEQSKYTVVGPCYIPVYMWGRGLKEFQEARGEARKIVLV